MKKEPPAYANGTAPSASRMTFNGIRDDVSDDVATTRFPNYSAELADALAQREVAGVELAAPLALDPKNFVADARTLSDVEAHDLALTQSRSRSEAAASRRDAAATELGKLPKPWSRPRMAGTVILYIALAIALGAVTSLVLAPTLDNLFLHRYYETRVDDADTFALVAAHAAACGLFFALCVAQLAAVLGTSNRIEATGVIAKPRLGVGIILLDIAFAGAWGVQRLGVGSGWPMAAGITLLEFVAAAAYSYALSGLASALSRNAPLARGYRAARDSLRAADRQLVLARRDLEHAEARRERLLNAVAEREAAERVAPHRKALTEQVARAAHLVAVAKMAAERAVNPSDDRLTEDLDELQAARRARLLRDAGSTKKKGR